MMCRFTWPVNADRIRCVGTPLWLFTGAETVTEQGNHVPAAAVLLP